MIKALIFDFDGLIIDTETPEYDSWSEVFSSYGIELDRRVWEGSIGGAGLDLYRLLEELSGKLPEPEVVRRRARQRYLERVERNPILPGVVDYINAAKKMGLRMAVASSSRSGWASGHLESRKLLHNFEFILSAADVSNVKPDPELYETAVQRLGVGGHEALALEDSFNGLVSAKAAGLHCVVVPSPMTRHMNFAKADLRLDSLANMTLDKLLQELQA